MATSKRKSKSVQLLEKLTDGPLTVGGLLESIRQGEEISQAAFARSLGISRAQLCDIEKGRRHISPGRAAEFARQLGYSETQFIRLSLQELVSEAGLKVRVFVEATLRLKGEVSEPAPLAEGAAVPWETVAREHLKDGGVALSVRAKRKRAGMSQAELAEALGIKQANVSEIETGKRTVGKDLAKRLAKVFSVDYRVFL